MLIFFSCFLVGGLSTSPLGWALAGRELGPPNLTKWQFALMGLTLPLLPWSGSPVGDTCLYFEDCSCHGPISGTDFPSHRGLFSWPCQEPGLFFSLTGPVGLTGSCSLLCHHSFFQREGASFLPSTYFQLSYILHKVNLANREHRENIFGFEASVF